VRAWPGIARSQEKLVKKSQKRNSTRTPDLEGAGPLDWTPLFQAFKEAFEWALDVAAHLARDYQEEVDAVERVRSFMRKRIAGEPAHVKVEDILFTFGLIIGSIERDLGPLASVGPWFGAPGMRFPSATELWERALPRHVTGLSIRVEGGPS
jgi:hypothetical protein